MSWLHHEIPYMLARHPWFRKKDITSYEHGDMLFNHFLLHNFYKVKSVWSITSNLMLSIWYEAVVFFFFISTYLFILAAICCCSRLHVDHKKSLCTDASSWRRYFVFVHLCCNIPDSYYIPFLCAYTHMNDARNGCRHKMQSIQFNNRAINTNTHTSISIKI